MGISSGRETIPGKPIHAHRQSHTTFGTAAHADDIAKLLFKLATQQLSKKATEHLNSETIQEHIQ